MATPEEALPVRILMDVLVPVVVVQEDVPCVRVQEDIGLMMLECTLVKTLKNGLRAQLAMAVDNVKFVTERDS